MSKPGLVSRLLGKSPAALKKQAEAEDQRANFVKSAELWRRLADTGDKAACHIVGERYELGRGVVQNFVEATRWFLRAAQGGAVRSQAKLGEIYFHGRGAPASVTAAGATASAGLASLFPSGLSVAQDYAKAEHWNRLAAAGGDGPSAVRLALQYAAGLGVDCDYAEAERWFSAAAA
jgi:uncharacterized protein